MNDLWPSAIRVVESRTTANDPMVFRRYRTEILRFFQHRKEFIDEEYYQDSFRIRVKRLAPTWQALNVSGARRTFGAEIAGILAEDSG